MDWVVVPVVLLVAVVELHGRVQDKMDFKEIQVVARAPMVSEDFSKDLHLIAKLKRDYQVKFSALASQSAIRNRIISPRKNIVKETQPHIKLYHRRHNSKPLAKMTNTNQIYIYTNPSNNVETRPNQLQQDPTIAQVHELYNTDTLKASAETMTKVPERNHVVLLPNGFLADTAEVQAAKRAHMKEVVIALAITGNRRG